MREWFGSVPDFVITVAADYGTQTLLSDAKYPPFAGVRAWHWGNGNAYVRAANSDGRIYRYSLGGSERTIDYDAAGNISVIVDSLDATLKQRSVYDDLDRVTDYFSDATSNMIWQAIELVLRYLVKRILTPTLMARIS